MCLVLSFIPATIFTTIGYFVLMTAGVQNNQGINLFGLILAIALFVIAFVFITCGFYMTVTKKCPMGKFFKSNMGQ